MIQSEYDKLRPGDIIFNMEESKGYVVTKVEEGHLECEDSRGWNSIPSKDILRWNWVSLMRDRELTWQDIKLLDELMDTVLKEHKDTPPYEDFYGEVLKRFNEQKV